MSLTYEQLTNICYVGTNADIPTQLPVATIINSAGQHLFNMHPWNFREGGRVNLTFSADQSFVTLPVDFAGVTGYSMSSTTQDFELTTPQVIAELIDSNVTATGYKFWGAIVQPPPDALTSAMPPQQLDIYPTPSSNATLRLYYRRGWAVLSSNTHIAQIPVYCEPLLIELVKAFSLGHWEDADNFGVITNVSLVEQSSIAHAAFLADGMLQSDYGPLEGGAIGSSVYRTWRSRTNGAVADPG